MTVKICRVNVSVKPREAKGGQGRPRGEGGEGVKTDVRRAVDPDDSRRVLLVPSDRKWCSLRQRRRCALG